MKVKGYVEGGFRFFFLDETEEKVIHYHHHNFHKCVIVYKGDITYTIEGQDYDLSEGSILWVPAFEMHKVQIRDSMTYRRCVVYLSEAFVDNLGQGNDRSLRRQIRDTVYRSKLTYSQAKSLLELFPYKNRELTSLTKIGLFIQFIDQYFRTISDHNLQYDGNYSREDMLIGSAIEKIRKEIASDLKIDQLANDLYVNKYYLMHRFKEITGDTLHQFIIRERLKVATSLMKKGVSLTTSAYESGFKNYTSFARCFKQIYHMAPRDYMKMHPIRLDSWKE